ncbi:hypothetical protein HELRODRAFT_162850 [Helobdella robusta]|uniref:Uncharacterized protein n=1 Tax=Helobdella robusta TaxID=6412 RepID=T1ET98_HELRO|nr:hypothetical protein HELRODRAFT_162850 [Helobdella robusta]ESN99327.1 hypothetical protein HELRODRAFT_162850 [Helobdella robusta]
MLVGFDLHINEEHCIWAYIFFFIHLHDTKKSDYTALELYVHKLLLQEKNDFFPLNRALSLSAMDEDSTESKVDELLRQIQHLVQKQKEEDARKKREEERQKQLRWKEEHRMALLQTHASMDLGGGSFGGGGSGGSGGGGIGGVAGYARGINKVTKSQYKQATRQKQWLSTNKSHAMDNILSNADAKNPDDNLASVIKKSTAFNDQQKKAATTAMPASSSSSTVPMVPFHQQTSKSADFETFEDDDDDDIGDENNEADDYDTLASDYLADNKNEIAKIGLSSGSLLDYPKSSRLGERQLLHYELPNKQQSIKQIMKFEPDDPFAPTVIPPLFFQSSKRSRSSSVQSALIGNEDDDVEDENVDDEFEISAYEPESQPDSNISKEEIKKYTKTDGRKLKPKLQTFQEILSNPLYESDSNSNTFKQMENFSSNASKHENHKRDGASAENQNLLIQSAEQIYQPQAGDGASNQTAMSLLNANILCSAPSAAMQLNQSKLSKVNERKHLQHKKRQSLNVHDAPKLWKPIKQQPRQQPDQTSSSQPPPYNQHLEHQQKKLDVSSQQTLLLPSRRSAENVITTKAAGDGQFFQLQQHHFYPEHEQFSDSQQQKPHQTHLHTSQQTSQQHSKDVQLGDEHSLKSTAKREDSENEEAIDDDDRIESTFV